LLFVYLQLINQLRNYLHIYTHVGTIITVRKHMAN
jgi:hypothetical protein